MAVTYSQPKSKELSAKEKKELRRQEEMKRLKAQQEARKKREKPDTRTLKELAGPTDTGEKKQTSSEYKGQKESSGKETNRERKERILRQIEKEAGWKRKEK